MQREKLTSLPNLPDEHPVLICGLDMNPLKTQ
jgi:hypothetical protein